MKDIQDKAHISVEDLLKLKRFEQPEKDFWENFEYKLQRRILQDAVRPVPSIWQRIFSGLVIRRFAWASLALLCVVSVGKFYIQTETRQRVYSTRFAQLQDSSDRLKRVLDCQQISSQKPLKICYDNNTLSVNRHSSKSSLEFGRFRY